MEMSLSNAKPNKHITKVPSGQVGNGVILVVDDDLTIQKIVSSILERNNYYVYTASNGLEALVLLEELTPDLILLDGMMPEMDGFDLCGILRKEQRFKDTPIIFITAMSSSEDKVKGFNAGGTDYVTKPVTSGELIARIRTHLELAFSRRKMVQQSLALEEMINNQKVRLSQVRKGQEQLLVQPESFSDIEAAVRYQPAAEAGGDFYDIVQLNEHEYGFIVADVAGHDLGSAYITGALKALSVSFTNETLDVQETMFLLNNSLLKFFSVGQYASASYIKFSRQKMQIDIINAGHPCPILLRSNGSIEIPDIVGDVLGIHDIITCEIEKIRVKPGDRLFIFTDGLIESYPVSENGGSSNRTWGTRRLTDQLIRKHKCSLQQTVDSIVDELIAELNGQIGDDVVLMGIAF